MNSLHEKGTKFIFNEDRGDGAKSTVGSGGGGGQVMLVVVGVIDSHIICGKMFRVRVPCVGRGHRDLKDGCGAVEFMTCGLPGVEV